MNNDDFDYKMCEMLTFYGEVVLGIGERTESDVGKMRFNLLKNIQSEITKAYKNGKNDGKADIVKQLKKERLYPNFDNKVSIDKAKRETNIIWVKRIKQFANYYYEKGDIQQYEVIMKLLEVDQG